MSGSLRGQCKNTVKHSRCFDITGGHENFAFKLVVKLSVALDYV
jgi:hypothetical protein